MKTGKISRGRRSGGLIRSASGDLFDWVLMSLFISIAALLEVASVALKWLRAGCLSLCGFIRRWVADWKRTSTGIS